MTLNFPNEGRSYDARRRLVCFWGYDSTIEVSFHPSAIKALAERQHGEAT